MLLTSFYSIALLTRKDIFSCLLTFYTPYTDPYLNTSIQNYLYQYIVKYSEYVIDWALIQGVLLAILIYFKVGENTHNKFLNMLYSTQQEYKALIELMDIIEEINNDPEFKSFCSNSNKDITSNNYIHRESILKYHNKLKQIYPSIKNSEYIWILERFSINYLLDDKTINKIISNSNRKKMYVCNTCKSFFFSTTEKRLCEKCRERTTRYLP